MKIRVKRDPLKIRQKGVRGQKRTTTGWYGTKKLKLDSGACLSIYDTKMAVCIKKNGFTFGLMREDFDSENANDWLVCWLVGLS